MGYSPQHTVAFSGHRSYKGGLADASLANRLDERIAALAGEGYDTFLCGMAEGFDLAAAQAVLRARDSGLRVRLIAVIPFEGQAGRFPAAVAELYGSVRERADEQVVLHSNYDPGCYHRRNDYLLANSSILLCYYNGSEGGTHYCVGKARRSAIRIINLYSSACDARTGLLF